MLEHLLTRRTVGYNTVALSHSITGKLPPTISPNPIPIPPPGITVPKNISLLTRVTFTISDPSQNHRLPSLQSSYGLLALRPATEKALSLCCHSLDCDLISLDLSTRLPFILKFKTLSSALQRGLRFEICYSAGITGGGSDARRNLISGATALIRATRGRGIVISSEAKAALGLRGPFDIINLCAVWGLGQEKGKEGVCEEARKVVTIARIKRTSFRGVVDIVHGGEKVETEEEKKTSKVRVEALAVVNGTNKRKAVEVPSNGKGEEATKNEGTKPTSKRGMKRQAKKARMEAAALSAG